MSLPEIATGIAIAVNLVGLWLLIWKGGKFSGQIQEIVRDSAHRHDLRDIEDREHRRQTAEIAKSLDRTVGHLDALEGRVDRLERHQDRRIEDRRETT